MIDAYPLTIVLVILAGLASFAAIATAIILWIGINDYHRDDDHGRS